ncbi:DUF2867 domain-containing protein [uncultured Brevundimonas sp.]|jgi:hypothetical protein|uniref:DUF2867 domain-containing protein n=1 Tax=uncultured Brevundimonas sp. TaxID=213418 RepID=UPI000F9578AF|nr:DUF2867 domain-containing protein [uncultured Brevundimonas sp.]
MAAAFELPLALPHPALPHADWADRFGVEGVAGPLTARQAMERMTATTPAWIERLMALRNGLVQLIGLKTGAMDGFPVLAERDDEVVVGLDDRHLDFRIVLRVEPLTTGLNRISLTTLVDRHNAFGRAYIAVVTPFHKVIVMRMLRGLAS